MSEANLAPVKTYLLALQDEICRGLEKIDQQATFIEDRWERSEGGGGRTRVISEGRIFEKGGVNFSHVHGDELPPSATTARPELAGRSFQATGVSLVLHPRNPFIPTVHANWRFFIATKPKADPVWWFGGGMDLTPYYGFKEDCAYWHQTIKQACDTHDKSFYPKFKQWCDRYFYLKHRDEHRGIGGIFFDDLNEQGFNTNFSFVQTVAQHFLPAYLPIVEKRMQCPYEQSHRDFQCYRRGRYVEFNLVYDRGTLFGLQSGGRTESILMSLPPVVHWLYDWTPQQGSQEAELTEYYLKPKDWV